ncbi:MAG TPA: DUF4149 domain-containing protein [Methylomirabilota bacterium]|nr:DUF4149 domain-containing protein [Methylomirabilota bacterium]
MRSLPAFAVLAWLAMMATIAFLATPVAFGALGREAAGRFVGALFPRYYAVGTVLGLVTLAALVARGLRAGWRPWDWVPVGLAVLMVALTLYSWFVILPAAHAAREAMWAAGSHFGERSAEAMAFARLHGLSSALNLFVMVAGVLLFLWEALRRP